MLSRFGGTGKKSNNKQFDTYGEPFGLNDVIGCYIDLDNFEVGFTKNGTAACPALSNPNIFHSKRSWSSI